MHSISQLVNRMLKQDTGAGPFVVSDTDTLFLVHQIVEGLFQLVLCLAAVLAIENVSCHRKYRKNLNIRTPENLLYLS